MVSPETIIQKKPTPMAIAFDFRNSWALTKDDGKAKEDLGETIGRKIAEVHLDETIANGSAKDFAKQTIAEIGQSPMFKETAIQREIKDYAPHLQGGMRNYFLTKYLEEQAKIIVSGKMAGVDARREDFEHVMRVEAHEQFKSNFVKALIETETGLTRLASLGFPPESIMVPVNNIINKIIKNSGQKEKAEMIQSFFKGMAENAFVIAETQKSLAQNGYDKKLIIAFVEGMERYISKEKDFKTISDAIMRKIKERGQNISEQEIRTIINEEKREVEK